MPTCTSTPATSMPIALLAAPELLEPNDHHSFSYSDIPILKWSHPDKPTLGPDERYLIIIPFKPKEKPEEVWYDWGCTTKRNWSLAEHNWLLEKSLDGQFSWSVTIIRFAETTGDTRCNELNITSETVPDDIALSQTSEKRGFTWNRASNGNGDDSKTKGGIGGI